MLLSLIVGTLTPARAQSPTDGPTAAEPSAAPPPVAEVPPVPDNFGEPRRAYKMEANFRARYLSVPDTIMDIWYFDKDESGANPFKRPKVMAYALGLEWVVRPDPENWIFYFEYIGNGIRPGYWDDVEEPADHEDGDWVEARHLAVLSMGTNYQYGVDVQPWLTMLFGGGVGVGLRTGELVQWNPGSEASNSDPGCLPNSAAYERQRVCDDDGNKRFPRVLPIVDLTASARFNFSDQGTVRLDAGFHDMFYLGTAVGTVF